MRITLVRHGKPAFELTGTARSEDLKNIARAYDASGIIDKPSQEIIKDLQGHRIVICSHLPRSIDSARALGFDDIHLTDMLFCETFIPYFNGGRIKLPIGIWLVLLRTLWLLGFSRNGESFSSARKRAQHAANRLVELANEHESVLLVGHGFMNYFIARKLLANGWSGPAKPGKDFWAYNTYELAE